MITCNVISSYSKRHRKRAEAFHQKNRNRTISYKTKHRTRHASIGPTDPSIRPPTPAHISQHKNDGFILLQTSPSDSAFPVFLSTHILKQRRLIIRSNFVVVRTKPTPNNFDTQPIIRYDSIPILEMKIIIII